MTTTIMDIRKKMITNGHEVDGDYDDMKMVILSAHDLEEVEEAITCLKKKDGEVLGLTVNFDANKDDS